MENKIIVIGAGNVGKTVIPENVILIEEKETFKITNPYQDLPIVTVIDRPSQSGKEKRRERRKQERKSKK